MIWYFTRTHFFQEASLHPSSKLNLFTYNTHTGGTTLPPYFSTLVLTFIVSYHLVIMFSWSPLELFYVAAPSSHPFLEHPSWVTITFMESIPNPFESRYSHPSFSAWSLSRVAHYGLQSHCPLSLMILCQSLSCNSCPLCSNKGSHPFSTQYPPLHHHH